MIHVLYHGSCYDGFGAAFSAWRALGDKGIVYTPCSYDQKNAPLEAVPDGSEVFVVDFSFKKDALVAASKRFASLLVLDHHASAEEDLKGLDFCTFDMNKSGAMLAWDFFHEGTPPPRLIEFIQDRDLWKFDYPETHAIHMGLLSLPMEFAVWDKLLDDDALNELAEEGECMLRLMRQQVDNICSKATMVELEPGVKIPACNTCLYFSEVPDRLLELYPDAPYAAYWSPFFKDGKPMAQWGLRSRKSGVDVSKVARLFGGGGHKPAAGFVRPGFF